MYIIEVVKNRNSPPCILLRESYRKEGKIVKKTLANLTHWPKNLLAQFRALLRGDGEVAGGEFEIIRSLPHGHVAAILSIIKQIELDIHK